MILGRSLLRSSHARNVVDGWRPVFVDEASLRALFNPKFGFSPSYSTSTADHREEANTNTYLIGVGRDPITQHLRGSLTIEESKTNPYHIGEFRDPIFQHLRRSLFPDSLASRVEKQNFEVLKNALQCQPGQVSHIVVHNLLVAKVYRKVEGTGNQYKFWFPVKFGCYESYDSFAKELMSVQEAAGINPRDYVGVYYYFQYMGLGGFTHYGFNTANTVKQERANTDPYLIGVFKDSIFQHLRRSLFRDSFASRVEKNKFEQLKNALQQQPRQVSHIDVHNLSVAKVYVKGEGPGDQYKFWLPVKFGCYESYDSFAKELMRAQEAAGISPCDYVDVNHYIRFGRFAFPGAIVLSMLLMLGISLNQ